MKLHLFKAILAFGLLQPAPTVDRQRLENLTDKYAGKSFEAFRQFLGLPNDARFPDHVSQNLEWVGREFERRGFATQILPTGGPPLLLAQRPSLPNQPTVLVYLQIDGQPVDPSHWDQESPYRPVLKEQAGEEWKEIPWDSLQGEVDREWRIFARSASDAKGPVVMFLTALDAVEGEGLPQLVNLKVIMDFEEELGSPHLPAAVRRHREKLAADALIIFDGPRHFSNRPTLTFGARGIATATLTVYGPKFPQHSGRFGNYLPNPALRLARLLASMKDENGRVTIPGFYDGVELDEATRAVLAQVPDDEPQLLRRLGVAVPDQVAPTYQESIQYPSLNIRGMASGWIGGEARTIIPSTATAEIDIRLTPESDGERLVGLVRNHLQKQGCHLIGDRQPTDDERMRHPLIASFTHEVSYAAFQTPYESAPGVWLNRALTRAFGEPPVRLRTSGGSIPISPFIAALDLPAVLVPTVNVDNNQHSPNENLRLGNYIDGVKTFIAVLTEPFVP